MVDMPLVKFQSMVRSGMLVRMFRIDLLGAQSSGLSFGSE